MTQTSKLHMIFFIFIVKEKFNHWFKWYDSIKWFKSINPGLAPAACECGTEEQTDDHVVLHCSIHWPPCGVHGLMVLDDLTIEWLLNTCPWIQCSLALDYKKWLKWWRSSTYFWNYCWDLYPIC